VIAVLPHSCDDAGTPFTTPLFAVPEPATGALLPVALLGTAIARHLRARRRRRPLRV